MKTYNTVQNYEKSLSKFRQSAILDMKENIPGEGLFSQFLSEEYVNTDTHTTERLCIMFLDWYIKTKFDVKDKDLVNNNVPLQK